MPKRPKYCTSDEEFRKIRNESRRNNYRKTQSNGIRREWTKQEDKAVLAHNILDAELSKKIYRSVQAIQIRRCRLKSNQVWGKATESQNILSVALILNKAINL